MFKARKHSFTIQQVPVIRTTASFVIVHDARGNEVKEAKVSEFAQWYETREAAVEAILTRLHNNVKRAQRVLDTAQADLAKFEKLEGL